MVGTAESFINTMQHMQRPAIAVSLRGRGKSSTPETGYGFWDHVSDIAAVVSSLALSQVVVFGHSTGAAFSIGVALQHPDETAGLAVGDYPAGYPPVSEKWHQSILAEEGCEISPHALDRIAAEWKETIISTRLAEIECPVVVIRAGHHSFLPDQLASQYSERCKNSRAIVIGDCGHDISDWDPILLASLLDELAAEAEIAIEDKLSD
jgi:pimeloyl-ACP methyl ester carboxylesterase